MTFLKINNLSVNYEMRRETVYAAKKVNINVEKGEILGLVGESGSGKSTVGNAIINLIDEPGKVSGGSIILDGALHTNINLHELEYFSIVLRSPAWACLDSLSTSVNNTTLKCFGFGLDDDVYEVNDIESSSNAIYEKTKLFLHRGEKLRRIIRTKAANETVSALNNVSIIEDLK